MDFLALLTFLFIYFVRPHDWITAMNGWEMVRPLMMIAAAGLLVRRGSLNFKLFLRTPLDWVMLAYFLWIVKMSPGGVSGIMAGVSLVGFYFLTLAILDTLRRQTEFLKVWTVCLFLLALMGVGVTNGFDVTGALPVMEELFHDRLMVNTWQFKNPNALGHTLVTLLPLVYFLFWFKRSAAMKLLGLVLLLVPGYCVLGTESKGAFLVGFISMFFGLLIGQRRLVQLIIMALLLTIGWSLLTMLPRMTELSSVRSDEAILGRLMAWDSARTAMYLNNGSGEGYREFQATYVWEGETKVIATHSSYVLLGAELGRVGVFLYMMGAVVALRMLLMARTTSDAEERLRRLLFTLLIATLLSGWMIDRAYHPEYFLILGAVAAFHRFLVDKWRVAAKNTATEPGDDEQLTSEEFVLWNPAPAPALAAGPVTMHATAQGYAVPASLSDEDRDQTVFKTAVMLEQKFANKLPHLRLMWIDIPAAIAATYTVFWFWDYVLRTYLW